MQILGKTRIDFLGKQPFTFTISAILLAVAIWSLAGGINRGIDFAGGTEIQVLFAEPVAIDTLREGLKERGIDASLQRIGEEANNEYLIRVGAGESPGVARAAERPAAAMARLASMQAAAQGEPDTDAASREEAPAPGQDAPAVAPAEETGGDPELPEAGGEDSPSGPDPEGGAAAAGEPEAAADTGTSPVDVEAPAPGTGNEEPAPTDGESDRVYAAVLSALREMTGGEHPDGALDLNVANEGEITSALQAAGLSAADAARAAAAAIEYRTSHSLFHTFDEIAALEGVTPAAVDRLQASTYLGPFTIRKVEFVGPRVGKELAEKAYLAMVFALAGMLVYITVRFRNLGYALGGIAALVHDGVIAAGVFNLWGGQFDLTIVAALLTLLGYSINDTIVVFDRVRENMSTMRGESTRAIFNGSINQTLSRTLLTSLTTLLVVVCLYLFGGDTIHGFAFLLLFGVFIGTYSTIFIASPVAILYQGWAARRKPASRTRSTGEKGASRGRAAS